MRGSNLRRERKQSVDIVHPRNQYDTVSISRTIATDCGVCAAFVFEDISRWIRSNTSRGLNIHDDKVWMFDTIEQIAADVGLFSVRTVKSALKSLVEKQYLVKGNYNQKGYDRTAWYALGNAALCANNLIVQNLHNGKCKNCTMDDAKIARPIPIENTKLKDNNKSCRGSETPDGDISGSSGKEYPQRIWDGIRKLEWPEFREFLEFVQYVDKEYGVGEEIVEQAAAKYRTTSKSPYRIARIKNWKGWIQGFMVNKAQVGTGKILADPNYLNELKPR